MTTQFGAQFFRFSNDTLTWVNYVPSLFFSGSMILTDFVRIKIAPASIDPSVQQFYGQSVGLTWDEQYIADELGILLGFEILPLRTV